MHAVEKPVEAVVCELGGEGRRNARTQKAATACKRDESALEHRQEQEKERRAREQRKRVFAEPYKDRFEALLLRNVPRKEWWRDYVFVCAPKEVKGMS
jgi:hypothetical protein